MTNGRVNPNFTLKEQGIIGLKNVYYNLTEPKIIEHALARKEGELGIGGAFLVSTGKFTGRSPDDKHIVKTASTKNTIWWEKHFMPTRFSKCSSSAMGKHSWPGSPDRRR